MRITSVPLLSSVLASACLAASAVAQDGLPTVIVAPFTGNSTSIQYWQPALGEGLSEMFVTELGRINKFQVLENAQLGVLKDEMKLGDDGFIAPDEKVDKGSWAGADFMFTGKVTQFGSKKTGVNLGGFVPGSGGNLGVGATISNVRIDWRLVDTATRKVLKTGSAAGEYKGPSFNVATSVGGSGGRIGYNNKEFMDSALGKATVLALSNIVADIKPFPLPASGRSKQKATNAANAAGQQNAAVTAIKAAPGKVLAVPSKDTLIVSLGGKQGFKDGDKLNLYETVDTKDEQGNVVFTDEKLVGEVTLQAVQDDRSRASYAGSVAVKSGWVVKAK
jgi:curli biogenesis system outer membrane secretion channel CsgG